MKKTSSSTFLIFAVVTFTLLANGAFAKKYRSTGQNVNVRARPSLNSEVLSQLDLNEEVTVKNLDSEWAEIVPANKIDFWVLAEYIENNVTRATQVNVRGGPGVNYSVVGQLNKDEVVVVRDSTQEWLKIQPPENSSLWVAVAYLEPVESEVAEVSEQVISHTPVSGSEEGKDLHTSTAAATEESPELVVQEDAPITPTATALLPEPTVIEEEKDLEDDFLKSVAQVSDKPLRPDKETEPLPEPSPIYAKPPANLDLVPDQKQGVFKSYSGILRPAAYLFNRPSAFRLISHDDGERKGTVHCYVNGNKSQLSALMGREMTLYGREYWVQGHKLPVIVPERIVLEY